jgi:hypothetical protein
MAQQRQKQQTQAGSHSGTRSSPSMESGGSAEAGAEAGDAVNTTTGKRKGRPSKQQDDAAEAKALKKAARHAVICNAIELKLAEPKLGISPKARG